MYIHRKQTHNCLHTGDYNDFIEYCYSLGIVTNKNRVERNIKGFSESIEYFNISIWEYSENSFMIESRIFDNKGN
jgi:hypothetical protein